MPRYLIEVVDQPLNSHRLKLAKSPQSAKAMDIRALVDMQSQADPKFQSTFLYTRISAREVRERLVKEKGYTEAELPYRETIGAVLNRLGYRLKKHKRQNP